jgi:3-dehydroquinate dehydratase II
MKPKPIYVLNGPNLNLLGVREPEIYGRDTLADIEKACAARAKALGFVVDFRQSNHEGDLIDWVQQAGNVAVAVILNPGAYTHTSIALYDAVKSIAVPVIEVHLSNPSARESFRRRSYVSPVAHGGVFGFGRLGYELAIEAAAHLATQTAAGQASVAPAGD